MNRHFSLFSFAMRLVVLFVVSCSGGENSIASDNPDADPGPESTSALTENLEAENNGESESASEDVAVAEPDDKVEDRSYAGTVPAPEFPPDLDWLNVDGPLTMADLRGKVVLLDFWTYGCINCIHIIPDLKMLEEKYAEELVVIGVHSAKFETEGETENIRQIVQRYELEHPVVNDHQFQIWSEYGARAWPTLVLIDPEGNVLGYHSGEGIYGPFDEVIGAMVAEFDELGLIDRTPLKLRLETERLANSPLLFPGKVLSDISSNRLFIADSNHNRIVVTDHEGVVLGVIGDGRARLKDGNFESASFFRPQGITLADENTLYVADTENHAIRKVNLVERTVETVAGTGQQTYMRARSGLALSTPLNSPWDVLFIDGMVFIAMSGQHQLWVYDPSSEEVRLFAGSGREELRDGSLPEGGLNQPSGLATDGELLYIADSEASAIRTAEFHEDGRLNTIVGTGLFDFGDVDGIGDQVRLQHPLGVDYQDGLLYVADTYNSKIKLIDPLERSSTTILGGDRAGWQDGTSALFDEPGGLSIGAGKLYIADTNNHAIRVADLSTKDVSTLVLIDREGHLTRQSPGEEYNGLTVKLDRQAVSPGTGQIELRVKLPENYKPNDLAPFTMEWIAEGDSVIYDLSEANRQIVEPSFPLSFSAEFLEGEGEVTGDLTIYYCQAEAQSLCLIERVRVTAPFIVEDGGQGTLVVSHEIPEPEIAP